MFYHDSFIPHDLTGEQLDTLLSLGWYRMNQTVFCTSHIEHDSIPYRVHWLRYPMAELKSTHSHHRLRNKIKGFKYSIEDFTLIREDHSELHKRYRDSITFNGALSIQDCLFGDHPVDTNIFDTKCISIFDEGKLIAGGYFDIGDESCASILHFYDPQYKRYSLGKVMILITLEYLRAQQYSFYYPGYVVEGLCKMDYKLFLGRDDAEYFDPFSVSWKKFHDGLLIKQAMQPSIMNQQINGTGPIMAPNSSS